MFEQNKNDNMPAAYISLNEIEQRLRKIENKLSFQAGIFSVLFIVTNILFYLFKV